MSAHLCANVKMEFVFVRMVTMAMIAVSVSSIYIIVYLSMYTCRVKPTNSMSETKIPKM